MSVILENDKIKVLKSPSYNYYFDKQSGFFARWGKTKEDDPSFSPVGPEIADIEISTICHKACKFCYKSNTSKGKYMTLETFKVIFDKLPKTVTQIAFGIGDIDGNPDLYKIMKYCRDNKVIPNLTINGNRMKEADYKYLVELCGAVAVSCYDKDVCYNTIKKLTDLGLKQTNIHMLLSAQTYNDCFQLIYDSANDQRLKKLNAIVFLFLKPKGERNLLTPLRSLEKYRALVSYALKHNARIGFDSCSASAFLKSVHDHKDYKKFETMVDACESTLFSYYIDVDGVGYPCSFCEGEVKGINIMKIKNFITDVWKNKTTLDFRKKLLKNTDCNGCRQCPQFDLEVK